MASTRYWQAHTDRAIYTPRISPAFPPRRPSPRETFVKHCAARFLSSGFPFSSPVLPTLSLPFYHASRARLPVPFIHQVVSRNPPYAYERASLCLRSHHVSVVHDRRAGEATPGSSHKENAPLGFRSHGGHHKFNRELRNCGLVALRFEAGRFPSYALV